MTRLPFACVSTPKGEVAETGAAVGGVIVEAGGGQKVKSQKKFVAERLAHWREDA